MTEDKKRCEQTTQEFLAIRFPNSYHLFPKVEQACSVMKTQNQGKGDVSFTAQGLDYAGRLIVKVFNVGLMLWNRDDESRKKTS